VPAQTIGIDHEIANRIARETAWLLSRTEKFRFMLLDATQQPIRPSRFQAGDVYVTSMSCDPFLFAEKVNAMMARDARAFTHVLVAQAVHIRQPAPDGMRWVFEIYGWWVPVRTV